MPSVHSNPELSGCKYNNQIPETMKIPMLTGSHLTCPLVARSYGAAAPSLAVAIGQPGGAVGPQSRRLLGLSLAGQVVGGDETGYTRHSSKHTRSHSPCTGATRYLFKGCASNHFTLGHRANMVKVPIFRLNLAGNSSKLLYPNDPHRKAQKNWPTEDGA
jgi:hypothetical protein